MVVGKRKLVPTGYDSLISPEILDANLAIRLPLFDLTR